MTEEELSSGTTYMRNRHRTYRYIRDYPPNSNNRLYTRYLNDIIDSASREHSGLGTLSHPYGDSVKATTVACDVPSSTYRIIELDKDAILQLIEDAIKKGRISPKDIIMLFAKLKEAKSNA